MSIKTRITFWYTAFLLLVVSAMVLFVLAMARAQSRSVAAAALSALISEATDEIEFDDGVLEADDDLHFYKNGAYLSVFDTSGVLLMGAYPEDFDADTPFLPGRARTVGAFSVLDTELSVKRYGPVRLRAVASLAGADVAMSSAARLALFALPVLFVIAALGGYYITKRAFQPVGRIADTAERIGDGKDLSKRIGLPDTGDELSRLSAAFDRMFDRLETAFLRERRFTADASHELRTPTAVILSESEYGLSHPEGAQESLEVIRAQSEKMTRLLSQLLALSRADADAEGLRIETINLSDLAEMVALEIREKAEEKGMTLTADLALDLLVRGDETMLMRLFINLLENAVSYGNPDGHITLTLVREGDMVHGTVADDGPGISYKHLQKVFERFYQVDPSRSGHGAGLGLSMVKSIAERHGGHVRAESVLGKGSSFHFYLPASCSLHVSPIE